MNDVGLVDDRVSEVNAEVLWCTKVDPSAPQKSGKLTFNPGKSEKTNCGSWLELDKHINIALGPEIRAQDGTKERKPVNPMPYAEFSYLFVVDFNCWCHVSTSFMP